MPPIPKVSPALLEHALLLIARKHHGGPDVAHDAREELAAWRKKATVHEQAFQIAQRAWGQTDIPELQAHIALPVPQADRTAQRTRRAVVTTLGVSGLVAAGGWWLWPALASRQLIETGRGQVASEVLADGSRVDLGAMTSMKVRLAGDTRRAWLDRGEVRFSVSRNPGRPFLVDTQWGSVRVLGTEFSISLSDRAMQVAVAEGLVSVHAVPHTFSDYFKTMAALQLGQGDAVSASEAGLGSITHIDPSTVGAWRNGWLVFDNTDLLSAIQRWNDYSDVSIGVRTQDQAALARLHITGSFPAREQDVFLKSLPKILPVQVQRQNDQLWVRAL